MKKKKLKKAVNKILKLAKENDGIIIDIYNMLTRYVNFQRDIINKEFMFTVEEVEELRTVMSNGYASQYPELINRIAAILNKMRYVASQLNEVHAEKEDSMNLQGFSQEELKTCLGQLMGNLRGDWDNFAGGYTKRLGYAKELCRLIESDTTEIEECVEVELSSEEDNQDGRIFRDCQMYGYSSEEGATARVKEWIGDHLSYPEYSDEIFSHIK